ncbi:MAG: peptide chain release factor N(5)-glutamine methyltransferase [Cytophagales bacterium]|nr:peptide chain release factor N(5)-glutamine methyltransferase [Cytophagales bacterium]
MDKTQHIHRYPRALRQWIIQSLSFVADVNERNSFSYMIMDHYFDIDSMGLAMNESREISPAELDNIKGVIRRLKDNEPIQYIFEEADFYGRKFHVNSNVLIPRQETELLVDRIIKENQGGKPYILDIGTGSGCIAVSLKIALKDASVTGMDVSEDALHCAKSNAARYHAGIHWDKSDILLDDLPAFSCDIIVSNPPYVRECEKALMMKNVLDYEPHSALFVSDRDPLVFYFAIAKKGFQALRTGGRIYLEINEAFGREVMNVLESEGFVQIQVLKDLQSKDRIVKGVKR